MAAKPIGASSNPAFHLVILELTKELLVTWPLIKLRLLAVHGTTSSRQQLFRLQATRLLQKQRLQRLSIDLQ